MDIAESDIFHHAAAAQRTLHTDTHIGSHESTVLHQNILYSAGHLTADDEAAMAFVHQTVMDVNIAAGPLNLAGNGIFAGLHADGIISGLKNTVMNMHISAGLHINAVTVLGIIRIADLYMLHRKVLAEIGVDIPCRRVHERYALQKHIFAMAQTDHHRAVKIVIGCRGSQCFLGVSLNVVVISF